MKINSNWYFAVFLAIVVLFALVYCDSSEDRWKVREEVIELAKLAAKDAGSNVHQQYFSCYALNSSEKFQ